MRLTHGAQTIHTLEGKRYIKSAAIGTTNVDEIRWLADNLIENMKEWREEGWGYIVDISKMSPVTPDIRGALIDLHKSIAEGGCKGMAFVTFGSYVLEAQAKQHRRKADVGLFEGHFKTEAEAMEWLSGILQ